MRLLVWISISVFSAFGLLLTGASVALADGGRVQFSQIIAPYRVTVFTSPTPLRAGPVDISVLVQQADSGEVVHDAIIDMEFSSLDAKRTITQRATGATSTNKLLQSATLALPFAGRWHVAITIQAASTIHVGFDLTSSDSTSNMPVVAICLTAPFLVIALFALREYLAAGQRQTRANSETASGHG